MARNSGYITLSRRDKQIAAACLDNADELVTSAELLLKNNQPHIAFHLAVIAMEEIGKRSIVMLNGLSRRRGELDVVGTRKLDDHVGKLFWAFFFRIILSDTIDDAKIDEIRGLARFLHDRRLEALYVDTERTPFKRPRKVISKRHAEGIVSMARAHVELERISAAGPISAEKRKLVAWLLQKSSEEQFRNFMFSGQSMAKLRAFGNSPQWVEWLHEQEIRSQETFTALVNTERERAQHNLLSGRPRWRFRIKLEGLSHKLKQTELNKWNEAYEGIKFEIAGAKQQALIIILTLPDSIAIDGLYLAGRAFTERIILALNISTLGFFWWESAQHTARFMEKLEDLDSNREIVLSETPELRINWQARSLTADDLMVMMRVFAWLPTRYTGDLYEPFWMYLEGLSFLATVNVHRRHESYAFRYFYDGLWTAMEKLERHSIDRSEQAFIDAVPQEFRDEARLSELYQKGRVVSMPKPEPVEITLEDVAWMKNTFDIYVIGKVRQHLCTSPAASAQ